MNIKCFQVIFEWIKTKEYLVSFILYASDHSTKLTLECEVRSYFELGNTSRHLFKKITSTRIKYKRIAMPKKERYISWKIHIPRKVILWMI